MKEKRTPPFLSLISLLLILSLGACRLGQRVRDRSASGEDEVIPGASGPILFQDDFQDGEAQEWRTNNAVWYVQQEGDFYHFGTSEQGGAWLPQGSSWQDYGFRASTLLNSGGLALSFNLTQQGRYLVLLHTGGVYLVKEQPMDNFITLAQTGPMGSGAWHSVAIGTENGHIQVYVDRVLWIDYTDSAPLTQGTIAVSSMEDSQVAVDNILVVRLSAPLPVAVVQAPPTVEGQAAVELAPEDLSGLQVAEVEPETDESVVEEPDQPDDGPGDLPELHIASITMLPQPLTQGQPMTVAVTVFNGGEADAGAFNVRWYPEGANFVGCSWDVPNLPAGQGVDEVCTYQGYPNAGTFNWGVSADADNEITESNEGNNDQSGDIVVGDLEANEPPEEPSNCQSTGWSMTSVTLGWRASDDSSREGFRIYQGTTSVEGTVGPQDLSFKVENLTTGVQYHFDVRAFNAAGESAADVCFVDVTLNP